MKASEKIKVLLLDDEYLIRMSVAARLRKTEYEIVGVGTPEEAVAALKKDRFQAIITDVMMGAVDGFMFRDIVRGMDREIPMIFFTSMMNDEGNAFLYRVLEDSYSCYLPKNAPTEALVKRLDHSVRAYRAEMRARLLQAEVEKTNHLASFVQTSMLPPWAQVRSGFYHGVYWKPFSQVSGDLYECIPIGKDASLLVYGDISGHGVSASLAMTAVQSYLKRFLSVTDREARDVAQVTAQIDRFILENLAGVAYMSGLVAYFNSAERRLRYCNAGSPDIKGFAPDGRLLSLNPDKRGVLPMGMMPGMAVSESDVVDITYEDGTVFFACSDGVTDLTADEQGEELLPEELLNRIVGECVKSSVVERAIADCTIPHKVMAMLGDFGYVHSQDDISMIVFGVPRPREDALLVEVPMERARIDAAAHEAGEYLLAHPGYESAAPRVELLIDEFFMNLHDHGFEDVTRHKEFALLKVILRGETVELWVAHRGRSWDISEHKVSADVALDQANAKMDDHGRGVPIIRKLTTGIQSRSIAGLNVNVFFVPAREEGVG